MALDSEKVTGTLSKKRRRRKYEEPQEYVRIPKKVLEYVLEELEKIKLAIRKA